MLGWAICDTVGHGVAIICLAFFRRLRTAASQLLSLARNVANLHTRYLLRVVVASRSNCCSLCSRVL